MVMGLAVSSRLYTLVSALQKWLLSIVNPKAARAIFTQLARRLVLWATSLRSKVCLEKGTDKPPEGHPGASRPEARTTQQGSVSTYAVIRNGDTVSWDGVTLSQTPSPPSSIDAELSSPADGHSANIHAVDTTLPLPKQPTDPPCLYPLDTQQEPTSCVPIQENPSSSLRPASSAALSHHTEMSIGLNVIPHASMISQNPESKEHIEPVFPRDTRRYTRRTRMSVY